MRRGVRTTRPGGHCHQRRWAKPLDEKLITSQAFGRRLVVTAEESAATGGFGDGVLDALNRDGVRVPLLKVALTGFVDHGAVDEFAGSRGRHRGILHRCATRWAWPRLQPQRGDEAPSVSAA